jgi:ankyrin repeat protein
MLAAAFNSNPDVISLLIKGGADVNAKNNKYIDGSTALMCATGNKNNLDVILVLIKGGADVNAQDSDGSTALMRAACNSNNPDVILALLKGGADANVRDKNGRRAIDLVESLNSAIKNSPAYQQLLAVTK